MPRGDPDSVGSRCNQQVPGKILPHPRGLYLALPFHLFPCVFVGKHSPPPSSPLLFSFLELHYQLTLAIFKTESESETLASEIFSGVLIIIPYTLIGGCVDWPSGRSKFRSFIICTSKVWV